MDDSGRFENFQWMILLMEEIPGMLKNFVNHGIKYLSPAVGFLPSTVVG